jgi:hypothetical protein
MAPRVGRSGKHVVGVKHVVQIKVMGGEASSINLVGRPPGEGASVSSTYRRDPVVMVTSRVHRDSRCSVAGFPWTSDIRHVSPGRTSSAHNSKLAGTPTASIATSAPSPPVSSCTYSSAPGLLLLNVRSAHESLGSVKTSVGQVDGNYMARGIQERTGNGGQPQ